MMAYCPECGSEVAPIDTFCPYCGIALEPVIPEPETEQENDFSAEPDETKLSEQETSVENNEFAAQTDGSANYSENSGLPAVSESEASNDSSFGESAGSEAAPDSSKETFEGKSAMMTESFELNLPSEEFKGEKISETDDKSNEKTEDFNLDLAPDENLNAVQDEVKVENEDFIAAAPESVAERNPPQTDNETGSNDLSEEKSAAPFKETFADESFAEETSFENSKAVENVQIVENTEETPAAVGDVDFTATIPYTPKDVTENEISEITPETVGNAESSPPKDSFAENPFFKEENKSVLENEYQPESENSIDVPQTPIPESIAPTPMYISIQPKNESSEMPDNKANESSAVAPAQSYSPPVAQEESKEARSYTSPNIGVSDTDGKKAAKLKPLNEGTILNGRYEIVRKIGGGGMGAVYLASDQNLGGVLRALKEMVQSYIEDEQQEKAINDFRRESMILSTLDHPSIPTIYDYFFDDKESRFYLVMKYINGGDLSARLRSAPEGRLEEKTVVEWAAQIADVLDYLHNRPTTIIYRDLKPSNVMIDGNSGRVMLIDFGIARSVNKEEKGVTAVGTMGYAPPELFSGNVEPRSDIYSLGSTMFHLLTGADPQSNPLLIFDFNKNPRPRQINSRLSDQIEQIITRAVEYNSGQRFNSAAEIRDALTKHLENLQKGMVTHGVSNASAGASIAVNTPVFCGFCGQKIVATDIFCPFCGAQQPLASQAQGVPPPSFAAPKLTARLMVIGTNELDAPEFSLEKENNLVGRRDPMSNIFPEVDLSKFDPQTKISRKHARIWRESNSYMLEDLGSSNGTVLMPPAKDSIRLLPRQPQILTHGDKIRVGDTTLHFFIG